MIESKKRKADLAGHSSSIKTPRLEEATPSAQRKRSGDHSAAKSEKKNKVAKLSGLDSIVLTKGAHLLNS
jgi:hypothetical protein